MTDRRIQQLGTHVLVDAWGCPAEWLDDTARIERALKASIKAGRATLIDLCCHHFSPQGVTATATLAESHISIHTWPEHGYFAADLFFCGDLDPRLGVPALVAELGAEDHVMRDVARGPLRRLPAQADAGRDRVSD